MMLVAEPARVDCQRCEHWIASYAGGTILVRWKELAVYALPPLRVKCRHCGYLNVIEWREAKRETA
jgi:ribosomal protein S27E